MRIPRTRRSLLMGSTLVGLVIGSAMIPHSAQAANCGDLASISEPTFKVTSATEEPAGFVAPSGGGTVTVPFCRVVAVATPVTGSSINFEVWLPFPEVWNDKLRGEGSGGSAGSITYSAMVPAVQLGYATMSNDNGHTGSIWTFADDPQSVIDFGYRAQHVTTVDAKIIVKEFYERPQRHAYFVGCSQGGHHAQMEAQRYPNDYDGIVGGDPASDWTGQMFLEAWIGLSSTVGGNDLPQTQLNLVTNAVLQHCVGRDGGLASDAFLTDPRKCSFDPAQLQCTAGQNPSTCLTPANVESILEIYQGPYDTLNGRKLAPGLAIGGETFWRQVLVGTPTPGGSSTSFFRDGIFMNPNYQWSTFNFGSDVPYTNQKKFAGETAAHILDANNTNLEPFQKAGGKIIMYHGWADPFVASQFSIDLYAGIVQHHAAAAGITNTQDAIRDTENFARLFMVPGMNHCAGGPGANNFGGAGQPVAGSTNPANDVVAALDAWVDRGVAPAEIIATKYNNDIPSDGVAFSRPLCTYPKIATYGGSGPTTSASSFACVSAEKEDNGPPILGINSTPNSFP